MSQHPFRLNGPGDEVSVRYSVVIISNQALRSAALAEWKRKIPVIGTAVSVPLTAVHCASSESLSSRMCRSESLQLQRATDSASQCRACGTS